jgi:hypothetical protein
MDPKKAKQQQIAIAALAAIFGLVVLNSLRTMGLLGARPVLRQAAARPHADAKLLPALVGEYQKRTQDPELPSDSPRSAKAGATLEQGYVAEGLRDPFKDLLPKPVTAPVALLEPETKPEPVMPAAAPRQLPPLTIRGKWWGRDGGAALINGQVYRVGDQVSGVTIRGIDHSGVTVEFAGRTVVLTSSGAAESGGFSPRVH